MSPRTSASSEPAARFRRAETTRPSSCSRRRPICWSSTRRFSASGRARSSLATRAIPTGGSTRWQGFHICRNRSCRSAFRTRTRADARPIFRAAFDNLTNWTHGKHREKPPAARYFKGSVDATDAFIPIDGCRWPFRRGGSTPSRRVDDPRARCRCSTRSLRAAQSCRARPVPSVRVPRWHLNPVQRRRAPHSVRSRHEYVKRVKRAADHLAAKAYISSQDRKALIAAAEDEPLPCHQGDDDGNDLGRGSRCPKP